MIKRNKWWKWNQKSAVTGGRFLISAAQQFQVEDSFFLVTVSGDSVLCLSGPWLEFVLMKGVLFFVEETAGVNLCCLLIVAFYGAKVGGCYQWWARNLSAWEVLQLEVF